MKKEISVHFKVIHKDHSSILRGIFFLEENQQPSLLDYEQCLRDCGHDVMLIDKEHEIFKAYRPGEEYLIHILHEENDPIRDAALENMARSLMR
ncbi:hypothetical protein [Paenibacillus hexagrammi]|uniref:Uncharacterized protein n=1 Tax=Paenibacillus hexagrammi TaxID=2908839 RepID=A0ABY3SL51_9BACL|nr:hypothetical protein [Paenibacillus sp. YPD9-1]UJF33811.1 hypothetical protein L0M14_00635 [Paenibacillus sp. YPD9-1]